MARTTELLSSYCSPSETAYAAANPTTRFAAAVAELQKAIDLANQKPGPGRPNARICGQNVAAAALTKEDAYWGAQAAIDAMPVAA